MDKLQMVGLDMEAPHELIGLLTLNIILLILRFELTISHIFVI